jgi:hypothetical protein
MCIHFLELSVVHVELQFCVKGGDSTFLSCITIGYQNALRLQSEWYAEVYGLLSYQCHDTGGFPTPAVYSVAVSRATMANLQGSSLWSLEQHRLLMDLLKVMHNWDRLEGTENNSMAAARHITMNDDRSVIFLNATIYLGNTECFVTCFCVRHCVSTFVHWKTAWLVDCALDVSIDWAGRVQKSKHNTSRNKGRPVVSTGTNFQREIIDYIYHTPRALDKIQRLRDVCGY